MQATIIQVKPFEYLKARAAIEQSQYYCGSVRLAIKYKNSTLYADLLSGVTDKLAIYSPQMDQVTRAQADELLGLLEGFGLDRLKNGLKLCLTRTNEKGEIYYLIRNQFEYWQLLRNFKYQGRVEKHKWPALISDRSINADQTKPIRTGRLQVIELAEIGQLFGLTEAAPSQNTTEPTETLLQMYNYIQAKK